MANENQNMPNTVTTSPAEMKKIQSGIADRLTAQAEERTARAQAQSTDSVLTTAEHLGKRPDEPHKAAEMEAVKVGKPIAPEKKKDALKLVPIDPAGKGEPTDVAVPAGFAPSSAMHAPVATPAPSHDQPGVIAHVAAETGAEPGGNKTPAGDKVNEPVKPDAAAIEGAARHAGENAELGGGEQVSGPVPAITAAE